MQKVNFLLPMKGHSERVPNKNLKLFAGRPLYHMVMDEIAKCKFLEKVYINTDSEKIADDATKNFSFVKIIWRPKDLIGDFVSMNKIIDYDISKIQGQIYLQTHSTNPLLKSDTINRAIEKYINLDKNQYDSMFSVTKWQTRFYWENGQAVNHNPKELLRTQDLPPMYEENSNFYIFTEKSFKASGEKRIGLRPYMYEMPPMEAIDIDTEFNFNLAQHIYETLKNT